MLSSPSHPRTRTASWPLLVLTVLALVLGGLSLPAAAATPADVAGAVTGRNGAIWQIEAFDHALESHGLSRAAAREAVTTRYTELHQQGEPVHTWPVTAGDALGDGA